MSLKDITIRTKLNSLAILTAAGFILVGAIYAYSVNLTAEASAENDRVANIDLVSEEIEAGMLQARRNEKDFLLRKDPKYIGKHDKAMASNFDAIARLDALVESSQGKQLVSKLSTRFKAYQNGFKAMVAAQESVGLNEKTGLLGALRNAVHGVEDRLKKHDQIYLTSSMLMMRRHEKDFLARETEKYVGRMAKEKAKFLRLLEQSSLSANEKSQIGRLMNQYHSDFGKLVSGKSKVKEEIAMFRDEVHAVDPVLEGLHALADQLQDKNNEYQQNNSETVTTLMAATLLSIGSIIIVTLLLVLRSIVGPLDRAVGFCKEISRGDLTNTITVDSRDEIGTLSQSLKDMSENLRGIVGRVKENAGTISTGSQQISTGNINLSQRTEEQASSLEETASSMEEMTSTVKQNADNANQASQLAQTARDHAETGGQVVSQAVTAMGEINASSNKIADIISVVEEIAFQTNLLALNAAVEAARAGEQGRGFAVVASEVRVLAGRSADAAKEIKALIEDSVEKVKNGSELVDKSGETLQEIVTGVKKVTDIVFEIAAASQEQSSGIDQVNKAVAQMDDMTQQNASMVEESTAASRSMEDQASKLNELMQFFKVNQSGSIGHATSQPTVIEQTPHVSTVKASQPVRAISNKATESQAKKTGTDGSWEDF